MKRACLTDGELASWLSGTLAEESRAAAEEHLADCPACSERLAILSKALAGGGESAGPSEELQCKLRALRPTGRAAGRPVALRRRRIALARRRESRILRYTAALAALSAAAVVLVALTYGGPSGPLRPGGEREADSGRIPHRIARLVRTVGAVEHSRGGAAQWSSAREGAALLAGDSLRTKQSQALVEFESGTRLFVDQFTGISLDAVSRPPSVSLSGGATYVETSRHDCGFAVETPHGRVVDLGTRFGVETAAEFTTVSVVEGRVQVSTGAGKAGIRRNQEVLLAGRDVPLGPIREALDLDRRFAWAQALRPGPEAGRMEVELSEGETIGGGAWKVSGSSVEQTELHAGNTFFLFGDARWRDYSISARVRVEETTPGNFGVGLAGYWLDGQWMLRARNMFISRGNWELTRGYGPSGYDVLRQKRGDIGAGSDVRFRLELRTVEGGTQIRARFWPASEPEPTEWTLEGFWSGLDIVAGRVGLWAYNCRARFSEITVRPLEVVDLAIPLWRRRGVGHGEK